MTKKPVKKNVKINKQKKTNIRKIITVVVIALFVTFVITALIYMFTNPRFNMSKLKIKGNSIYTIDQIQEKIKVKKGSNIFVITESKILDNLKELPYIGDVKIDRKLPSTITINIIERKPAYLSYNKETAKYVRLSKEGIILEVLDRAEKSQDELLVFGINFDDNLIIGEKIADLEYNKIELYNRIKKEYDKYKISKEITSIKFENNTVSLVLEYNLSVIFEEKDMSYDMSILGDILKEIEGKAGTIDMTKPDPIFTGSIN